MPATPPAQLLSSPGTPNTPLHGARYDDDDSPHTRSSSRLRQRKALQLPHESSEAVRSARTPASPRKSVNRVNPAQSPTSTPKRKPVQRSQFFSPPSSDSESTASQPAAARNSRLQPFLSSHTTISEGMLPTPIKTPTRKHIPRQDLAARTLFQDTKAAEVMAPASRRPRKHKRFNGFSLESFRAEGEGSQGGIQIFTDSRDHIPEADSIDENPFVEEEKTITASKKMSGTSKRRKISGVKPLDPQVEEAIRNDEGMVYVFRGKKVYRRFDDSGEEEEEIDANDLGLLEHLSSGGRVIRPLKTMTRKSIKPTRLFQTEQQARDREAEKHEEAVTDIEDASLDEDVTSTISPITRSKAPAALSAQSTSSTPVFDTQHKAETPKRKRTSPFDSWARLKPGSTVVPKTTRSRKRAASQELEELVT